MAGKKINDLTALGRNLASTDLLELSLAGGTGSRKITGQEIINAIPSGITIGTTAITSGTVGRVLFEGTGNVVQESANLFWDNTNGRLGVGTSSPTNTLELTKNQNAPTRIIINNTNAGNLAGSELLLNSNSSSLFAVGKVSSSYTPYKIIGVSDGYLLNVTSGDISILNDYVTGRIKFATNGSSTSQMTIASTGNVLINTTTDAGYKLDVNGTARVSGNTTLSNGLIRIDNAAAGSNPLFTFLSSSPYFYSNAYAINFGSTSNGGGAAFTNGVVQIWNQLNLDNLFILSDGVTTARERLRVTKGGSMLLGTTTNIASSKLTIESTTQGFLPPRMTTTQKNAIASPATGLVIFDSNLNRPCFYNGTSWITL